jgi:hypothetical protein
MTGEATNWGQGHFWDIFGDIFGDIFATNGANPTIMSYNASVKNLQRNK